MFTVPVLTAVTKPDVFTEAIEVSLLLHERYLLLALAGTKFTDNCRVKVGNKTNSAESIVNPLTCTVVSLSGGGLTGSCDLIHEISKTTGSTNRKEIVCLIDIKGRLIS
jgi:hypothetical protein